MSVRSSKFRHVFSNGTRKENCYEGFRLTNCAFEGNFIAANKKFIAVCVEVGGAGAFSIIQVDKTGRLDTNLPKVSAHKEYILDMQFNPYNDNMLATCSEDGTIRIWDIPDTGLLSNWDQTKTILSLEYHERKCTQIQWHPIASNVLLSVSQDKKICIWNLDDGVAEVEIVSPDIVYNAAWSLKGDKIVTACKDKKFRIYDARTGNLLKENTGHEGSKPQRIIFTFNDKYLFSTGFSKMSERQYACWDGTTLEQLNLDELDTANGVLIPHYDPDTQMAYLVGRGDSNIRFYELVDGDPYFYYLNTYQSKVAGKGLAPILKRSVDVNTCEVMRFYKLHGDKKGIIEPLPFQVPRKSELFQEDIYPDCISDEAAIEASEWFEGKNVEPNRICMSTFFSGKSKPTVGGLKKGGGLKGLKAKKDAKAAAKATHTEPVPVKSEEPAKNVESAKKEEPKAREVKRASAEPSAPAAASGADPKVLKDLQNEVKSLKENEKKLQKELKGLTDKLKDYDKLTGDIKLLCDAVKKNDERIATLEALVQEESEGEEGGE